MDRGRILIMGKSKETTYEIRNLIDNQRYELEIALSQEVGKQVLSTRKMSLIMIHTEMLQEDSIEFFEFLRDRAINVPVLVLGDEAMQYGKNGVPAGEIHCFDKPYTPKDVISCIRSL